MTSHILGGAMLPHAPQFFTLPQTEDKATVARVRQVAAEIGARLKALKPDLWIVFANDHAEQFFLQSAPPFTVHVGGFHLAPAPDDYLRQVMAGLTKFDIEHVMPMHCSGQNFVDLAQQVMPEKLVLCGTGSSFTFTA
jgi:hypothetical protein